MAYVSFDDTKPDPTTQSLTAMATSERQNFAAMRDAVVLGSMAGWDMAQSGGTAEQPAALIFSLGTERCKVALTWGSSGGEDGNVTVAVLSYSSDSGSNYDTIGTATFTYDSSGNCTAVAWS